MKMGQFGTLFSFVVDGGGFALAFMGVERGGWEWLRIECLSVEETKRGGSLDEDCDERWYQWKTWGINE
jgi:hypothetical protein